MEVFCYIDKTTCKSVFFLSTTFQFVQQFAVIIIWNKLFSQEMYDSRMILCSSHAEGRWIVLFDLNVDLFLLFSMHF